MLPRDLHFNFNDPASAWLNGDLYISHFFNAASIFLPQVEGFVNFTVNKCQRKIKNEDLRHDCDNFIKQETLHSREHIKYNKLLAERGFSVGDYTQNLKGKINHIKTKWSLLSLLGIALGFESFTAIISQVTLEDDVLKNADSEMKRFWSWHMMEELEHKSLLMDVYQELGGGYFRRVAMFVVVMFYYCYFGLKTYLVFLRKEKLSQTKGFLWIISRKSFFRKSIFKALNCFRPSYHPNMFNTKHLLNFDMLSANEQRSI